MASFRCAHIHEQGNDIIIVPLDETFPRQGAAERARVIASFREAARAAGLRGTVVPVWPEGERIGFLAPRVWHPFFRRITWSFIRQNLNRDVVF